MIKVLFDLKQLYYWAMMKPIYDELALDKNFSLAVRVGANSKRFLGLFLISSKKNIEKQLQSNGYNITNSTSGYDYVFCGDALKNPKEFGNATLCHVDHSISIKSQRYRSLKKQSDVNYVRFVEGDYRIDMFKKHKLDKQLKLVKVGSAKLDAYYNGKFDKQKFIQQYKLDSEKKIIVYAPSYKPTSIFDLGKSICDKNISDKYNVIIKLHPYSWAGKYASHKQHSYIQKLVKKNKNVVLVSEKTHNAMPFLFAADTMISDASGVINEFLALGKCGIIFNKNYTNLTHSDGEPVLVEDLSNWLNNAFVQFSNPGLLNNAINSALNPSTQQLKNIQKQQLYLHEFTDGNATKRIHKWLSNNA